MRSRLYRNGCCARCLCDEALAAVSLRPVSVNASAIHLYTIPRKSVGTNSALLYSLAKINSCVDRPPSSKALRAGPPSGAALRPSTAFPDRHVVPPPVLLSHHPSIRSEGSMWARQAIVTLFDGQGRPVFADPTSGDGTGAQLNPGQRGLRTLTEYGRRLRLCDGGVVRYCRKLSVATSIIFWVNHSSKDPRHDYSNRCPPQLSR